MLQSIPSMSSSLAVGTNQRAPIRTAGISPFLAASYVLFNPMFSRAAVSRIESVGFRLGSGTRIVSDMEVIVMDCGSVRFSLMAEGGKREHVH